MNRLFHNHRRSIAVAVLCGMLAAWVLPVQACMEAAATPRTDCADCASAPCCQPDRCCCGTVAAACAASMLPADIVSPPSPARAAPVSGLHLDFLRRAAAARAVPAASPAPAYPPPASLNVRYCRYQE